LVFLEGWLLSGQAVQFKKLSKSSDCFKKSHFVFGHANWLIITFYFVCGANRKAIFLKTFKLGAVHKRRPPKTHKKLLTPVRKMSAGA